jgi:hypothetical protein
MKNSNYITKIAAVGILALGIGVLVLSGCNSGNGSRGAANDTSANNDDVPAKNPDGMVLVRGTIVSASDSAVQVKTADSNVSVKLVQPFHLYSREASTLASVKNTSFVGVTSVKQADGTELATEIHIFPEELRGLGEGSYMMNPTAGGDNNRMTNGSVSASRMTNGTATAPSRMSNGNVTQTNGSTLEVQYQGHDRKITVPPNVTVTELKLTSQKLAVGMPVALMVKKGADSIMTSGKGVMMVKK